MQTLETTTDCRGSTFREKQKSKLNLLKNCNVFMFAITAASISCSVEAQTAVSLNPSVLCCLLPDKEVVNNDTSNKTEWSRL